MEAFQVWAVLYNRLECSVGASFATTVIKVFQVVSDLFDDSYDAIIGDPHTTTDGKAIQLWELVCNVQQCSIGDAFEISEKRGLTLNEANVSDFSGVDAVTYGCCR